MIQNLENMTRAGDNCMDICATAKGYEAMSVRKIQRNGGMLV